MARSKPITIAVSRQLLSDFFARISVSQSDFFNNEPCWDWTGAIEKIGRYAQFSINGCKYKGHRLSFSWFREPIPEGLVLDHLCRRRHCVNPNHLEIVTIGETIPVKLAERTHCKEMHEFTPENTGLKHERDGIYYRTCKECHRARARQYWHDNLEDCHRRRRERRLLRKRKSIRGG